MLLPEQDKYRFLCDNTITISFNDRSISKYTDNITLKGFCRCVICTIGIYTVIENHISFSFDRWIKTV